MTASLAPGDKVEQYSSASSHVLTVLLAIWYVCPEYASVCTKDVREGLCRNNGFVQNKKINYINHEKIFVCLFK